MLKRHPICPPINTLDYNTTNLHDYDPYILKDDNILIDEEWFSTLTPHIKNLIHTKLDGNYKLGKVEIPHPVQIDNTQKMLKTVYQSYIDGFDYNIWYNDNIPNGPKGIKLIYIPFQIKIILADIFKHNNQVRYNDNDDFISFKEEIQQHLQNPPYFVRLSSTSGKNEEEVEELYTVDEIIHRLTSIKQFLTQEYEREKDSYLILIPWNDHIDPRCEFRIFVVNNKLTGASIQAWHKSIQHSKEELKTFELALNNIPFLNTFPYTDFVADVYVNCDTQTCHLIEVNPFGAHSGAGSSLFNWEVDYKILHGKEVPELRYQSAINF
jgi:hypothetical protein